MATPEPHAANQGISADQLGTWAMKATVLAGAVLVVARFLVYMDVVTETGVEIGFQRALTWWSIYVVGIGLFVTGAAAHFQQGETAQRGWSALLAGLIILALMGGPGFEITGMGGFFGS